jgi:hypothetical protein
VLPDSWAGGLGLILGISRFSSGAKTELKGEKSAITARASARSRELAATLVEGVVALSIREPCGCIVIGLRDG